jgi:hypothetical protein
MKILMVFQDDLGEFQGIQHPYFSWVAQHIT